MVQLPHQPANLQVAFQKENYVMFIISGSKVELLGFIHFFSDTPALDLSFPTIKMRMKIMLIVSACYMIPKNVGFQQWCILAVLNNSGDINL